jgi:hypothetical protein
MEARIRIRIQIKVKGIYDPDPHQGDAYLSATLQESSLRVS